MTTIPTLAEPLSLVSTARVDGPASETEMARWKGLVAIAAASGQPLHLHFFGGANQITGYRAYYMLQLAKAAGVAHLTLHTDGGFWIDEATAWLGECGVDAIVLHRASNEVAGALRRRIDDLSSQDGHRPTVAFAGDRAGA